MPERSNGAVLKIAGRESVPWVQIPVPPFTRTAGEPARFLRESLDRVMSGRGRRIDSRRVIPNLRSEPLVVDPLTGFGNRAALLAHLAEAVEPLTETSVFAVFGLDGLDAFEKAYGTSAADDLISRLAEDFAQMVRPEGLCYAPRRREFCAIFELPLAAVSTILAAAAIALRREAAMSQIAIAFGIAVLPGEAADTIEALQVADRNLIQVRKAQRRARSALG